MIVVSDTTPYTGRGDLLHVSRNTHYKYKREMRSEKLCV